MPDKDLFEYCRSTGLKTRMWKNRFLAALPEVEKRRLYKKRGFCSIYEFAAKLAGVSRNVVDECMRIDKKLTNKPKLKALISENGLNKVRIVAGIAREETQDFWVEKVKLMTKSTLETYIKELRKSHPGMVVDPTSNIAQEEGQNSLFNDENVISQQKDVSMLDMDSEPACGMAPDSIPKSNCERSAFTIRIDSETELELRKFKQKIEKERHEVVDWNTVMKEMVKKANTNSRGSSHRSRSTRSAVRDARPEAPNCVGRQTELRTAKKSKAGGRYVPAALKRQITEKYSGGCAFPGCNNPATVLHHPKRFSLQKNHDNLKPLCEKHHELAHQGLIEGEEKNSGSWRVKKYVDPKCPKYIVDRLTMRHKMALSSTN